ncbi:ABC transporter permease [Rhodoplanes elegans]|uniref:ABC transporter permease n=1 Tax=Rhodoplanes elegans TaxID=29408 RepID=A0A327KK05_9BRAD|nr:efflux RND transporter permease subunit [Rhodoplanes elegans]MBK5958629.1 ABC transporter permease [Rhodoplanes elegans]RAI37903.1 ABC transporter permease [Rhodoplanes elegans]
MSTPPNDDAAAPRPARTVVHGRNNISAWAIRHPVATVVLFVVLTMAGLVAYPGLRINNNPDIDLPAVVVTVQQPGAAPAELESQVTRRIEDAVAGLGDIKHITSTVYDGASNTVVEFNIGKNVDRAVNDVRDKVTQTRATLPADILEPIVSRVDISGGAIVTYTVRAPAMSTAQLSWFIDDTVARALLSIAGVSRVNRVGGVDREIRIELDPARLMALGITAVDVHNQLRSQNLNSPGGRGTLGASEQSIRTVGSAETVDDLRARLITLPGGRKARLSELGTVEDTAAEQRQSARLDNQPVVAFEVLRTVGSSEVHVAKKVAARLEALEQATPGVEIRRVSSTVRFVEESYRGAIETLVEGAALAVLVVFLFLRDLRATFIAALAMPLSLIPTFFVMKAFGFALSGVTLLALSLVVGILVDDAIVEIENIVRHMRDGKKPYRAALDAADEIGLAVVATTLTIVAVFVPVAFMPGIPGQFFFPFGVTVSVAVLFSLVVARMLTPLLGAYFLKVKPEKGPRDGVVMRVYLRFLAASIRHRWLTVIGALVIFAGSIALIPLVPSDLMPARDTGRSALGVELPPGATLAQTEAVVKRVTDIAKARPDVTSVFAAIGVAAAGQGPGAPSVGGDPRNAIVYINYVPANARPLTQQQIEAALRPALAEIPGTRFRFGADGMGGAKVTITLTGDNPVELDRAATALERQMRTLPSFPTAASTASLRRPEIQIVPMPERAAELGVSVASIAATARIATLGDADQNLAKFNLPNRQIPIRVQIDPASRASLPTIENLRVSTTSGASVPLKAVAEIRLASGPATIQRLDRTRKAAIEAELNGLPLGEALTQIHALPIMRELPASVREQKTGDAEIMVELFVSFAVALGAGVLLVYVVMVVLFGGFMQPLTIMMALPLAVGGAMTLLLVTGKALSISAVIGVLMLMGIVAKNSILLVEYAIEAIRAGMPRDAALLDAAHKRARPIVMTTIAMTAGMIPVALGLDVDSGFRAPMAVAVIGGLITSTLLSLVVVPSVFTLMDDLQKKLGRRLGRLLTSGPQDDVPAEPHAPPLPAPAAAASRDAGL